MSTVEAKTPGRIRRIYPQMPRHVGRLLQLASEANDQAIAQLSEVFDNTKGIDPWHHANLKGIFHTRHSVPDREQLAVDTIVALNSIKQRVKKDQPFLNITNLQEYNVVVGRLDNPEPDFIRYPSLSLKAKGVSVSEGWGQFPDFIINRERETTIELAPTYSNKVGGWDFLQNIAAGVGNVVLGNDHIEAVASGQYDERKFYTAMAVKVAGIGANVPVSESVRSAVGETLVDTLAYSVAGFSSPDTIGQVEKKNWGMGDHTHVAAPRSKSFQDFSREDLRSVLYVVGMDEETLKSELTSKLDRMAECETSTSREIAGAMSGKLIVASFAESYFA